MNTFVFTNSETFEAFKFLQSHRERLTEILNGNKSRLEHVAGDLEEWIVEERPIARASLYDNVLESALLKIDFENLTLAVFEFKTISIASNCIAAV